MHRIVPLIWLQHGEENTILPGWNSNLSLQQTNTREMNHPCAILVLTGGYQLNANLVTILYFQFTTIRFPMQSEQKHVNSNIQKAINEN